MPDGGGVWPRRLLAMLLAMAAAGLAWMLIGPVGGVNPWRNESRDSSEGRRMRPDMARRDEQAQEGVTARGPEQGAARDEHAPAQAPQSDVAPWPGEPSKPASVSADSEPQGAIGAGGTSRVGGKVVGPGGRVLVGQRVRATVRSIETGDVVWMRKGLTDLQGRFAFDDVPDAALCVLVELEAPPLGLAAVRGAPLLPGDSHATLRLQGGRDIHGRILDAGDIPMWNPRHAWIVAEWTPLSQLDVGRARALPDRRGGFVLRGLPRSASVLVSAVPRRPAVGRWVCAPTRLSPDETNVELQVHVGGVIRGKFSARTALETGEKRRAILQAASISSWLPGFRQSAAVGADGGFQFSGVPDGSYLIQVHSQLGKEAPSVADSQLLAWASVRVPLGDEIQLDELPRDRMVRVEVGGGEPASALTITVFTGGVRCRRDVGVLDAAGEYRGTAQIPRLPGVVDVLAVTVDSSAWGTVEPGADSATLRVKPASLIRGSVPANSPNDWIVQAVSPAGAAWRADRFGDRFVVRLPEGKYDLKLWLPVGLDDMEPVPAILPRPLRCAAVLRQVETGEASAHFTFR